MLDLQRLERIAACAQGYVDAGHYAGIEWQLQLGGMEYDRGVVGYADPDIGLPVPEHAIYRIYSMTKPVIACMAMQLIEQGKLHLATPVAKILPALGNLQILQADGSLIPARVPITIEHLLTHRAGFTYDFLPECHVAGHYRDAAIATNGERSLADFVTALASLPLAFEPGSAWRYSVSIDVLAHVLECVTGTTLPELLQRLITDPLQMIDTRFDVPAAKQHRLMPMFGTRDLNGVMGITDARQVLSALDVEHSYPSTTGSGFVRGGHGLFSTTADYLSFMKLLSQGKNKDGDVMLSPATVDWMWANRIPASQQPLVVGINTIAGYGWNLFGRVMIDTGAAMKLTSHGEGGWAGAASTYFWVDRQRDFHGIVMTQYLGAQLPLADDMQTAAYQSLPA